MNKFPLILLLLVKSTWLFAQTGPLSKDTFLLKVRQSFDGPVQVLLLDSLVGSEVDSLYNLPKPIYKAKASRTSTDNAPVFFYYYLEKDFDTVVQRTFPSVVRDTEKPGYITDFPLMDPTTKTFLIYFYSTTIDSLQEEKLYKSVVSAFKFPEWSVQSVQLEEIKNEEANGNEPPPSPPKPAPKKVIRKPHKKSPA